jgi:hypothetical protein
MRMTMSVMMIRYVFKMRLFGGETGQREEGEKRDDRNEYY